MSSGRERRSGACRDGIVGDYDGDGKSDVLWYAPGTGSDFIWWGASRTAFGPGNQATRTIDGSYAVTSGDFDGNNVNEIYFYRYG
ncbi:MAG: VCBS repeat-containing protein [Actinobacteria bacterium]|nr:VCBS repeat-containing protein [Actinomycetota bacterium]